jgi:hypothetical protein
MAPIKKTSQQSNRLYLEKRISEIDTQLGKLRSEKLTIRKLILGIDEEPLFERKNVTVQIFKNAKKDKKLRGKSGPKQKLPDNWVFCPIMSAAEFLTDLRNLRINSGIYIQKIVADIGCSDKMLYAVETGKQFFRKDTFTKLAKLYGISIANVDISFHYNGRYVRIGDERLIEKTAKQPKPIGELRKKRAEKQNKSDRALGFSTSTTPIVKPRGPYQTAKNAANDDIADLPSNLRCRENEPTHSIRSYTNRNYSRIRNIVKGLCTSRLWDFDETMSIVHDELLSAVKIPIEDQPTFNNDNERFISWVMALCKSLNRQPSQRVSKIEDIITGNVKKADDFDELELRAYFKESLKYKPDYYKVVVEKYVFDKLPVDAAARSASVTPDKAANALYTVRGELISHFKSKYSNLIKI